MVLAIYAIVLLVHWFCPAKIQILMLIANIFLPDAIPIMDEACMTIATLKNISKGYW